MNVSVNGCGMEFSSPCSVHGLLEQLDLAGNACAVEVNERVVPKADHETCRLADGDTVEIVTLVGGG